MEEKQTHYEATMIQRVSELDQYYLSTQTEGESCFVRDYLDDNPTLDDGSDNPNYLCFKNRSFYNNLSDTMLFEISLGRPMSPEDGSLDDSNSNEEISYYKSYKVGGDVIGMIAANAIKYFPITFGSPGPATQCAGGDMKYPNNDTSYHFYGYAQFDNDVTFHSPVNFHDNVNVEKITLNVTSGLFIGPGIHNDGPTWHFDNPIHGVAMSAYWADLAECYKSDADYPVGTLVQFGGKEEITIAESEANAVITEKPGFVLNSSDDERMIGIALTGRTPVRVIGPVKKFDKLCFSGIPGVACSRQPGMDAKTIAVALEGNDSTGEKLVLCAVQLSL